MAADAKVVSDGLMFHVNNPAQFNSILPRVYDVFLTDFGRHGKALVPGLVAPAPVKPTVNDVDALGQRLYALAKSQDAQGTFSQADYVPPVYGPDLTRQSYDQFKRELDLYDVAIALDLVKLPLLIAWLLKHCSPGSRAALDCLSLWHTSKLAMLLRCGLLFLRFISLVMSKLVSHTFAILSPLNWTCRNTRWKIILDLSVSSYLFWWRRMKIPRTLDSSQQIGCIKLSSC